VFDYQRVVVFHLEVSWFSQTQNYFFMWAWFWTFIVPKPNGCSPTQSMDQFTPQTPTTSDYREIFPDLYTTKIIKLQLGTGGKSAPDTWNKWKIWDVIMVNMWVLTNNHRNKLGIVTKLIW
jgi:hypothetical protein